MKQNTAFDRQISREKGSLEHTKLFLGGWDTLKVFHRATGRNMGKNSVGEGASYKLVSK